jgi:S1-C subfamily serine protease
MNRRVWKTIALVTALLIVLAVGAAIGGGIVYAGAIVTGRAAQMSDSEEVGPKTDPEAGIVIIRVTPDSPAAQAGVVRGDILLEVNGERVGDLLAVRGVLAESEPGDEVVLVVLHGDEERTLKAIMGDRDGNSYLGLLFCGGPSDVLSAEHTILGSGALVTEVIPGSPAEQAGLKVGDRIVAIDGRQPSGRDGLASLVGSREPGDRAIVRVERPGEEPREITVELGENPDSGGEAYLGVRYISLPHIDMPERHGLPSFRMPRLQFDLDGEYFENGSEWTAQRGAIIERVIKGGPAEAAGLVTGDVVTAIDGESVWGPGALVEAVGEREPGDTLTLTVARSDKTEEREVEVRLGEDSENAETAYLGVVIGGFDFRPVEGGELPSRPNLRGRSFQFRLPFVEEPVDLGDLEDALRRLPHYFGPWNRDGQRVISGDDSV